MATVAGCASRHLHPLLVQTRHVWASARSSGRASLSIIRSVMPGLPLSARRFAISLARALPIHSLIGFALRIASSAGIASATSQAGGRPRFLPLGSDGGVFVLAA